MKLTAIVWMLAALNMSCLQVRAADAPASASSAEAASDAKTAADAKAASDSMPPLGAPVPSSILRGGQVSLSGDKLPSSPVVKLCAEIDPQCTKPYPIQAAEASGKSIKFTVPPVLQPGTYRVGIAKDVDSVPYLYTSAPLDVTRVTPTISALSETALYPTGFREDDYADLQVQGTGFAVDNAEKVSLVHGKEKYHETNQILINGVPLRQCDQPTTRYCTKLNPIKSADSSTITVSGIPRTVAGKVTVAVRVENATSNTQDILLSRSTEYIPRLWATLILAAILILAAYAGFAKVDVPLASPTARIRRWKTIFIDWDSNTYSLSRLQLVIWTFVALFGWVYLSVARSLIQGMVTFSDIPSGLPGVLAISVGTSVVAGGVAAVKGGKSSGPFSPSFSDFYSVGGIVAPERAQFFLWTIVGAVGFIVYTLALDPATIQDLPKLPDGFLQLAGISALGYVGGKAVRKAGPVLTGVTGVQDKNVPTTVTWTLTGTGLGKNAKFSFKEGDGKTPPVEKPIGDATVVADDADQDGDPTLFKKLTVTTTNTAPTAAPDPSGAKAAPSKTAHNLRLFVIINSDGQRAEWPY